MLIVAIVIAAMLANPIEHFKKKEKEEEEITNRRKALDRLLDDEEKKNIPGYQDSNGRSEDKVRLSTFSVCQPTQPIQ